jgi:putative ABC transport system permease protein
MEATIGHYVQQKTNLKIGDTFAGAHGLTGDDMHLHADHLYKVVGILEKTGTVLDQLILTNVQSVWAVHAEHDDHEEETETPAKNDAHDHDAHAHDHDAHAHDAHDHDAHAHDAHDHDAHAHDAHAHDAHAHDAHALNIPLLGGAVEVDTTNKMLTNVLIQYQRDSSGTPSAMADIMLARIMDEHLPSLGYAYPLRERDKLLNSIGIGFDLLKYLAYLFMFVSALSIFISLYTNMKERRYEMALMRVMGSSAAKVSVHVLLEGMLIAALGGLLGILVAHSGMSLLSSLLQAEYRYQFEGFFSFYWAELVIFLVALFLGALASLLPAYQAYKTNISSTLSEG